MKHKKFRIYINNKYYFTVFVFKQERSMYKFEKSLQIDGLSHSTFPFHAITYGFLDKKEKNQLGILLFTFKSAKNHAIVAHELVHAASMWYYFEKSRHKWENIHDSGAGNEHFAQMVQRLVDQFTKKAK